jgi:hypothetical protein
MGSKAMSVAIYVTKIEMVDAKTASVALVRKDCHQPHLASPKRLQKPIEQQLKPLLPPSRR